VSNFGHVLTIMQEPDDSSHMGQSLQLSQIGCTWTQLFHDWLD